MGIKFWPQGGIFNIGGGGRGAISVSGGSAPLMLPAANRLIEFCADLGVTKTDAIDGWKDQSSNGYDLTGTTTARPAHVLNDAVFNRHASISFGGSHQLRRVLTSTIQGGLTTYATYIVFAYSSGTAIYTMYAEGSSTNANPIVAAQVNSDGATTSAGAVLWLHRPTVGGAGFSVVKTDSYNDGACHIMTIRRISAASWSLRIDGVEVATSTANPGATATDRLSVGALERAAVAQNYTGKIATIAAYSADNYQTIEPLLGAYYGVTLPPFEGSFTYASTIGT